MKRVVVPRALCVPGGLPPVCLVSGSNDVVYEEIVFDDVRFLTPFVLLATTWPFALFVGFVRVPSDLGAWVVGAALGVVGLLSPMPFLARRTPRLTVSLPLTRVVAESWRRRRATARTLLRAGGALALASGFATYGYILQTRTLALSAMAGTLLVYALVPVARFLHDLAYLDRSFPRRRATTHATITLDLPSDAAARAIEDHLAGRTKLATPPEGARCANHDGQAELVCARCGDFACATCAPPVGGLAPLCASCRAHVSV